MRVSADQQFLGHAQSRTKPEGASVAKNANAFLPGLGPELDGCKAPQKICVLAAPLLHTGLYKGRNCWTTLFRNKTYLGILKLGDLGVVPLTYGSQR
jgi:hypothetical protein